MVEVVQMSAGEVEAVEQLVPRVVGVVEEPPHLVE
jgi:hypothetical protein